ncbi:MAG: hypothetical protein JO265_16935 [Acidimicrobiia bacterium]|nr:hypothetical protein [Acidimicrobiia bacterium]
MRIEQLEHLIRAAGRIVGDNRIMVVGSQAILASYPDGLPWPAVMSLEADLLPFDDPDGSKADQISGSIGEASQFQETVGVYADGVDEKTALLPAGWRDRLIPVMNANTGGVTGLCLEAHDLCISKLVAGRPKDNEFCRVLLESRHVRAAKLRTRLESTDVTVVQRARITAFLNGFD